MKQIETMRVTFNQTQFEAEVHFDERQIVKSAGFSWNNTEKKWYTFNPEVAARLGSYCDLSAKNEISRKRITLEPWTHGLFIPKEETLHEYQKDAALFALSRNRSYLALDPGLGKTPIAAVIAKTLALFEPTYVIYLCPPFLTRNTEIEFKRFAPRLKVRRFTPGAGFSEVTIIPDSLIHQDRIYNEICYFVNEVKFRATSKLLLIVDEAHRFKNETALRTKTLFGFKHKNGNAQIGLADFFDRIVYLSGTPMPNRPMELFPVLNHSAPQTIQYMNRFKYGLRYCAGYRDDFGWVFTGASNLKELTGNVKGTFMLRMKKELANLPPKVEEMVILDQSLPARLSSIDSKILHAYSPEDLMKGVITLKLGMEKEDVLHLSTYRKELGMAKVAAICSYIKPILYESNESLLIFAIHKEVIAGIRAKLHNYNPLVITGDTPMHLRHEIVKTFQLQKEKRVLIGNIQAMGTGLTLTKASRVIMAEFSWVPADNDQAGDRSHRIGQTETVVVQYLVLRNSVDRAVMEALLKKKRVTEQV